MRMTFGKTAGLASVFLLGLLLGPLLVATGKAVLAGEDKQERLNEARMLISAYQAQLPPNYLFLSIALDGEKTAI